MPAESNITPFRDPDSAIGEGFMDTPAWTKIITHSASEARRLQQGQYKTDNLRINPERFADALAYATALHAHQTRKGTDIPYISHLLGVCSLVIEHGGNEDEAVAALLHDALEDQGHDWPFQAPFSNGAEALRYDISARFGQKALAIIEACTDADTQPKPPWRERKEAYLTHLRTASDSARLVSCADKLHNARAILADYRVHSEKLWDRFNGGRDGTLWYYLSLAEIFGAFGPKSMASELEAVVTDLKKLAGE